MILRLLTFTFLFSSMLGFSQQWEQLDDAPFIKDHGIGFSLDGFGYVLTGGDAAGGVFSRTNDFYKYDPNTDTWEQLPDAPGPERGYGIGDVWNGKVYFGFGSGPGGAPLDDLWSWDPTNGFESLPDCPCSARYHPAFVISDGKIYVGASTGPTSDWWEYDIATQNWAQKTNLPGGARHHPYQFAIDGDVYVGNGHQSTWYKFDVANNTWSQIASLSPANAPERVAGTQFSYNGKGYALSGTDDFHTRFSTGEFWEYDPINDDWTALPNHDGFSRFAPTSFVIDNYVYFAGGYNRNDFQNIMVGQETMYRYQLGPSPVGIEETIASEEANFVYPNPSNNDINISLNKPVAGAAVINIYGLSGQLVMTTTFEKTINISELTNGIYVLDVVDETGSVLKQKISKI